MISPAAPEPGPARAATPDPAKAAASIAAGREDAKVVATGERVVRAILAHHATETFAAMCPDLDLEQYLEGYRSEPGSEPPMDRRKQNASGPEHPRRRWDDYYT